MAKRFDKDPSAVLDYGFDLGLWLKFGETITTSTWSVFVYTNKSGVTNPPLLNVDSNSENDTYTTCWLSGGIASVTYRVTNRIVTNQGRTDERSFLVDCVER